jgi:hypothetical protein
MLRRYAGVPNRQFLREGFPGIVVGALVVVALTPLRMALDAAGWGPVATLAALAAAGVLVYLGALRLLFPRLLADLRTVVMRLGRRRRAAEEPQTPPVATAERGP